MFCGILHQTHVANSHTAFGQLFWFSGKCVFVQKVLKRIIQNTPRKGPVFGHMGRSDQANMFTLYKATVFNFPLVQREALYQDLSRTM